MHRSSLEDNEFSDQDLETPAWFKSLSRTIKFDFDTKCRDENFTIVIVTRDWFSNITKI